MPMDSKILSKSLLRKLDGLSDDDKKDGIKVHKVFGDTISDHVKSNAIISYAFAGGGTTGVFTGNFVTLTFNSSFSLNVADWWKKLITSFSLSQVVKFDGGVTDIKHGFTDNNLVVTMSGEDTHEKAVERFSDQIIEKLKLSFNPLKTLPATFSGVAGVANIIGIL